MRNTAGTPSVTSHAGKFHFKLAILIVASRSAADEDAVVFGPIVPIIPKRRVHQHQALAGIGKRHDAALHFVVGQGLVGTQIEHRQLFERSAKGRKVLGVKHRPFRDLAQSPRVGGSEPLIEIVRTPAAEDERFGPFDGGER